MLHKRVIWKYKVPFLAAGDGSFCKNMLFYLKQMVTYKLISAQHPSSFENVLEKDERDIRKGECLDRFTQIFKPPEKLFLENEGGILGRERQYATAEDHTNKEGL